MHGLEANRPHILLVCDKADFSASIEQLLRSHGPCRLEVCSSALEGRDRLQHDAFDICFVNSPLEGNFAVPFINTLVPLNYATIVFLAPAEIRDETARHLESLGVLVLRKPLHKKDFLDTFDMALVFSKRARSLYEENARLRKKIHDLKLIDRAKVLLVEYLKLSEEQAHKYIEQQAMELRKSRAEIAQSIISTYDY